MSTIIRLLQISNKKNLFSFHTNYFSICKKLSCNVVSPQCVHLLQPSLHKQARTHLPFHKDNLSQQQSRLYAKRAGFKKDKKDNKSQAGVKHGNDEELLEVFDAEEMRRQMEESLEHFTRQLDEALLLRPTLASIASIIVKTPDGNFPLGELAQIQQKTAQLLLVNMSEHPELSSAAKVAILQSTANVTPQIEGTTLYLPVQKVTREHREKLAKGAKSIVDKAKERLRGVQHRHERELKKRSEGVSEDVVREARELIVHVCKEHLSKADQVLERKQAELLQKS